MLDYFVEVMAAQCKGPAKKIKKRMSLNEGDESYFYCWLAMRRADELSSFKIYNK